MIITSQSPDVEIPEISLTRLLLERTDPFGDNTAIIDGPSGRQYTFAQLNAAIRSVAANLVDSGFRKGDTVALCSPNLPEYAIAFHGVALAGGVVTTINPLYTAQEMAKQFNDSGAIMLVTIGLFLDKAREAAAEAGIESIYTFDGADGSTPFSSLMQANDNAPDVAIDPHQDLVVLPYSSGTTGLSKGVMLSHHNLVSNICQVEGTRGVEATKPGDVVIGVLPFFHIYGMVVIMNMTLITGATIVTVPRFDMEEFLQTIEKYRVTRASLVPPIVLGLTKHPIVDQYDTSSLVHIGSGAAPLGEEISLACGKRLGCLLTQGYGLTETSPVTHTNPYDAEKLKHGSAGLTVPNTETKIVDLDSGQPLGFNQRGEVCIRGPQVMKGYLNNPEATAHCIDEEGWFHTGDIGYFDEDEFLFVVDRLKELIKYKGFQVAPAELEALLLAHPDITDAAVIPSPDDEAGEIPKAFVVANDNLTEQAVMDFVAASVSPQKKIRIVEFTDEIPKSLSGKILRRVLVDRERERAKSHDA